MGGGGGGGNACMGTKFKDWFMASKSSTSSSASADMRSMNVWMPQTMWSDLKDLQSIKTIKMITLDLRGSPFNTVITKAVFEAMSPQTRSGCCSFLKILFLFIFVWDRKKLYTLSSPQTINCVFLIATKRKPNWVTLVTVQLEIVLSNSFYGWNFYGRILLK